jgi:shikimate kinase
MITALIGHRGVGKTALLKRPEILFSRREDVILSDLDFEIENRAGRSIASNNLVMSHNGHGWSSGRPDPDANDPKRTSN